MMRRKNLLYHPISGYWSLGKGVNPCGLSVAVSAMRRTRLRHNQPPWRILFGIAAVTRADTPGVHRPDFASYTYRRLRRPIYPLDPL
jgi:hypothetical protein